MLKIKFIVIIIYFSANFACYTEYCRICQNHTLCKYKIPGPSAKCIGYDTGGLLTEEEHNILINKMNERRNFIATGRSRQLPGAANMKKIEWSAELAMFAQRWVDQCDQYLRPDREDQCRDLGNMKVGQNIATITGSSSGYSVKSFVEIWYMQSVGYTGSVTYYNQSNDYKTNYFTQLIWADSDKVGCGKAKFFIKNVKPIIVERLVCNFATKGNIQGKPVYTIGYAATQCDRDMDPDKYYPGLCSRTKSKQDKLLEEDQTQIIENKLSSENPLATSLLRIRNLINDSTRQEIDPIYYNLKQMGKKLGNKIDPSYRISIHDDAVKRSYPSVNENFHHNNGNRSSRNGDHFHRHEKGHSRVYHNHDLRNEFDSIHPDVIQHKQRYDLISTTPNSYANQDYRKHNNKQCTRKSEMKSSSDFTTKCVSVKDKTNQCTRGQNNNNGQKISRICQKNRHLTTVPLYTHELCACDILQSNYPLSVNRCYHNINCDCDNANTYGNSCVNLRTLRDIYDTKLYNQKDDYYYYDMFQNDSPQISGRSTLPTTPKTDSLLPYHQQLKILDNKDDFNKKYSERRRRVSEEKDSFNPLLQMDEFVSNNRKQLKSRYTTLSNKRKIKQKKSRNTSKIPITIEPITLTHKNQKVKDGKRMTEKYLSFDELMHLRKYSTSEFNARRHNEDRQFLRESNVTTTAQSPQNSTEEYTANTPYVRMKHCTRKLTCTWTAASLTDNQGSLIPIDGGSRTPPGYVEGCTRTSTCTRDYMNRNKMATMPIETTTPDPDPGDDEDYCERRSLNRRSPNRAHLDRNDDIMSKFQPKTSCNETTVENFNCICGESSRRKRDYFYQGTQNQSKNVKRESKHYYNMYKDNSLSYGDLFYYIVKKLTEGHSSKNNSSFCDKCPCNNVNKFYCCKLILFLTFLIK